MGAVKNALLEILECQRCNAQGFLGYVSDEDFDFEWCECNPHHLDVSEWSN